MTLRSVFSAVTRRRPAGQRNQLTGHVMTGPAAIVNGAAWLRAGVVFFLEPCGIVEAVELRAGWNGFPGRFEPAVWAEL